MATADRAVLIDLGLARTLWTPNRRPARAMYHADFRPPEFGRDAVDLLDPAARAAGDIFALGKVFLYACFARRAHADVERLDAPSDFVDLIRRMTRYVYAPRIVANDAEPPPSRPTLGRRCMSAPSLRTRYSNRRRRDRV